VRSHAFALAIVAATAVAARAQTPQDTFRLRPVVITAARMPTSVETAPGAVTVLSGELLRARGVQYVADALRTVPGVSVVQSAGPGALTSVFMRGGESDYVQVLVDGVQVNDPGGSYNWAHLQTQDVERIEIVRGPSSVLYGSDAVAGVVQIFTRAGGPPRLQARFTGERGERTGVDASFYNRLYDVSLTGSATPGSSSLRYGANIARSDADGLFAYNSDYDNTAVSGRVQLTGTRFDIAFTGRNGDNEYHYPTGGSGALVDRNQFAVTDTRTLAVDAGVQLTRRLEFRILATDYRNDGETDNAPDSAGDDSFLSESWLSRRAVDGRVNVLLPLTTVLTLGVEHERQHGTTSFVSNSSFGEFRDSTDNERDNNGYYAQLHGTPVRAVTITLGGRIDDNSAFGDFRTGRIAASWAWRDALRIRGAAGTAFKEPTFFENFATGFARGNPELEPETSRSWEVGAEHLLRRGALAIGATWFDQEFENLIQYTFATPAPGSPNYFNIGVARARGLEVSARGVMARVNAHGSYTLTRTTVVDQGFGDDMSFQENQPLLRRPRHQASLGADFAVTPALRLTADARYVGERDDLDFTDPSNFSGRRVTLDAYATVAAGVVYDGLRVGGVALEIALRVRNVFDEVYEEAYSFPTEGRVLQISVGPAFNFAQWPF
jgi:vitamin B12 transporter